MKNGFLLKVWKPGENCKDQTLRRNTIKLKLLISVLLPLLLLFAFAITVNAEEEIAANNMNKISLKTLREMPLKVILKANGDEFLQRDRHDVERIINYVTSRTDDVQHEQGQDYKLWLEYLSKPHPSVKTMRRYFSEAAKEFGVPVELLLAIGQVESNWTQIGPSIDRGWGVMHLVQNNYADTLAEAAVLIGVDPQILKDDPKQNIRGAAALLVEYAGPNRSSFTRVEDWFDAAKRFSGLIDEQLRGIQAKRYFEVLKEGKESTTLWNERITLKAQHDVDMGTIEGRLDFLKKNFLRSSDYPPAITNLTSCNYTSDRNYSIDTWVNHWIGTGTYAGAISWFHNCSAQASAHFVIRSTDGEITQVVRVADTAWHVGAIGYPYNNSRSIGVEHEATAANPNLWNSTPMLQASANMARYFCDLYSIPKTRSLPGIRGHKEMPGTSTACPGPLPWDTWMGLLNSDPEPQDKSLIRAQGGIPVYWLQNGIRYHVVSAAIAQAMTNAGLPGWTWPTVNEFPQSTIDQFSEGPEFIESSSNSNGLLIRQSGTNPVYVMVDGKRRWIQSQEALNWKGNNWNTDVIEVASAIISNYVPTQGDDIRALGEEETNSTIKNSLINAYTRNENSSYCASPSSWKGWPGAHSQCLKFPKTTVGTATVSGYSGISGKYQTFDWGTINYTSMYGAFEVHGAIFNRYASLGYSGSLLGFPVSDEYQGGSYRRSDFEGGYIYWNPSNNQTYVVYNTLPPPTGVSASDGTYTDRIRITWNSVSGASYYRVYRNTTSSSSGASALGSWQSSTTYNDYSATPGIYYYWVKAATRSSGANASDFSTPDTGWQALSTTTSTSTTSTTSTSISTTSTSTSTTSTTTTTTTTTTTIPSQNDMNTGGDAYTGLSASANATEIGRNVSGTGYISYPTDEYDQYKIPVSDGEEGRITFTPPSGATGIDLYVYQPNTSGGLVASNITTTHTETVTVSGNGYVYFTIDADVPADTGTYSLNISVPDAEPAYLLWTHTAGTAALWPLDASGTVVNAQNCGPFAGWTAHHYHHTSDGTAHLLWTHIDGRAAVWTLNASGAVVKARTYGPYAGWTARHYHCTSDGTVRLLWTHIDGRAAVWTLNASGAVVRARTYGPYAGWTFRHYHHTSDGTTRLLWTHTAGTVALWTLNASGAVVRAWTYGPFAGWTVRHYHHTSDGTVHVLWTHTDGRAALWILNASGAVVRAWTYGPYAGWTARHAHPTSDGTAHLLWTHTDGTAALWTLNASGMVVSAWDYGPFDNWTAVECHRAASGLPASLLGPAGNAVIIRKAGSGTGTMIADDQECGPGCGELSVPYVEHGTVTLQVIPDAQSTFVRWETADGRPIAGLHYAQPGDTVIAVFEETP